MEEEIIEAYENSRIVKNNGKYLYIIDLNQQASFSEVIFEILKDDNIEEIMYNGEDMPIIIYHHKYGMCNTNIKYNETGAIDYITNVASTNGKSISKESPILDAILPDGSRLNAVIPPAVVHLSLTIRKFKATGITVLDLVAQGVISNEAAAFLWLCIERKYSPKNILFVGGTASGKTVTLNAFTSFINSDERVIVIEDTPELQITIPNTVRMISKKEANIEMDLLLKNALRMRPDRIIVGEVRGSEAITLFNAMNTGHNGCLGTLHANSAKETISRITNMPMNVPISMVNALNLIVVMKKEANGKRHVEEISELVGDSESVSFNKIYQWDNSTRQCLPTGIPSRIKAKIAEEQGKSITDIEAIIKEKAESLSN